MIMWSFCAHGGEGIIDAILANDGPLPIQMVEQYSAVDPNHWY